MLALYRSLLYLYPAAYRCEYGEEMMDVLLEVQGENQEKGALALFFSSARETGGLVSGAVREHFYSVTGSYDNGMFSLGRRFAMRSEFRFPKATVGLMIVILAAVMFTIEKARAISVSIPHASYDRAGAAGDSDLGPYGRSDRLGHSSFVAPLRRSAAFGNETVGHT